MIIFIIIILLLVWLIYNLYYDEFSNIYFEDLPNIKFAIIIPTFNRSNGKSISYLKRSLDSIIKQKHKYWDIILVGDKFEPESLIIDLVNNYQSNLDDNNKIIYINNPKVERDYIKNKYILWSCAGANSVNIGLKYARDNNYKYYCHLDDDDYWSNTHLLHLAKIYTIVIYYIQ
jgi:glycosyltransferase involved in cell wall biosynthesis